MKTTETKSSTHSQQHQAAETQSASQEQEHAFFSEQAPETAPFFSSSAFPTIQAKQNNSRSLFFQPSQTLTIQRKCAACKTEEKQTSPMQVQRMPAFESEGEAPGQAKLTIGQPNDRYEQEADRVAARVVSAPTTAVQRSGSPLSSFKQAHYLQRKGGAGAASAEFEQRLQGTKSGGTALNEEVRGFMEPRFGADFSQVRVHTDTTAVNLNKEVGAKAFTHGNDIYFNSGKYTPNSTDGKELLAHELTHTIQQTGSKIRRKINKEKTKSILQNSKQEVALNARQVNLDKMTLSKQTASKDTFSQVADKSNALDQSEEKHIQGTGSGTPQKKSERKTSADNAASGKETLKPVLTDEPSLSGNKPGNILSEFNTNKEDTSAQAKTLKVSSVSSLVSEQPIVGKGISLKQRQDSDMSGKTETPQSAMDLSTKDPQQIINQLKSTPATQLGVTFAQAGQASAQALDNQRNSLIELNPDVPAPTGLPPQGNPKKATPKNTAGKTPNASQLAAPQASGGAVSAEDQAQIPEAPPAPALRPTQLAGNDAQPTEGQNDEALSRSAQNTLSQVSTVTSGVSTQVGPAPTVDLSGDADPTQVDAAQAQSAQEVQAAKLQAQQEVHQDFGENNIFPKASNETLKANKELTKLEPFVPIGVEGVGLPGEAVGGLNQSLSPYLQDKVGVEQKKYQIGKVKFDTDSQQARLNADQEMAQSTETTRQQQLQEQQAAQAEVAEQRQEWQAEINKADQSYQEKAAKASTGQKQKIDAERTKGEEKANLHLKDAEQKAEAAKQKADTQANNEKQKAEKDSGGFWGWAKSAAKSLIDGLKSAVNAIYNGLRSVVKGLFEAAKKLAVAAIDLARNAVVGLIKRYGEILKGLVKVVFAAFPGIANRINAKIDQAVQKAAAAVNTAADLLKKGITAILDALATAIDGILAAFQDMYNVALDAVGAVVKAILEVSEKIGNLVSAAQQMPDHFWSQMSEEFLGMDVTKPLAFERTAEDCTQSTVKPSVGAATLVPSVGNNDNGLAAMLSKETYTENDIAVEQCSINSDFQLFYDVLRLIHLVC